MRKGLAIAAIPAAIAAGMYGHDKVSADHAAEERPAAVKLAAEHVAQRYECDLDLVENRESAEIPVMIDDGEPRMEVRVGINLTPDPIAAEALKKYATDDTVRWYPSAVGAVIKENNGDTVVVAGGEGGSTDRYYDATKPELDERPDGSARLEHSLFPRKDYEPGTEMDIFVVNEVMTTDDLGVYDTRGVRPCAKKAVWNGKTWDLVSSDQSIQWSMAPRITEKFTPWQK